jgi:hypothetical protein
MNVKFLWLVVCLEIISIDVFCQSAEWKVSEGQAVVQKSLILPGKSASAIYKEIYRWLMKRYEEPEDILKARLENEYLCGSGYYSNLLTGSDGNAGLQYTFSFDIENEEVTFKIFDAAVLFSNTQDDDREYPIELYLVDTGRKKHPWKSEKILSATHKFSDAIIRDLEESLLPTFK